MLNVDNFIVDDKVCIPRLTCGILPLAYTKPVNSAFIARYDWFPRIFLTCMAAHEIDNMASRFPESLSEVQISEINKKTTPINTNKVTKFGWGVFQGKVLF